MKKIIVLIAGLGLAIFLRADAPPPVTYMDAAKVAEALAKTGLITSNAEYMVAGAHREKPGQVELHEKTTDILFVVEGEALYVTGGKMIDGKQTRPGEWIGTNIEGGVEHRLKKGDVIVVPQKIVGGSVFWKNMLASAQVLSSIAFTAALALR